MEHPEPRIRWLGSQRRRAGRRARPARRGRGLPAGGPGRRAGRPRGRVRGAGSHSRRRTAPAGADGPVRRLLADRGAGAGRRTVRCSRRRLRHPGVRRARRLLVPRRLGRIPAARTARRGAPAGCALVPLRRQGGGAAVRGLQRHAGRTGHPAPVGTVRGANVLDGGAGHGRHAGPGRPVSDRFTRHIGGGGRDRPVAGAQSWTGAGQTYRLHVLVRLELRPARRLDGWGCPRRTPVRPTMRC